MYNTASLRNSPMRSRVDAVPPSPSTSSWEMREEQSGVGSASHGAISAITMLGELDVAGPRLTRASSWCPLVKNLFLAHAHPGYLLHFAADMLTARAWAARTTSALGFTVEMAPMADIEIILGFLTKSVQPFLCYCVVLLLHV